MVVPTAEPVEAQSFDVVVVGGGPAGYAAAFYGGHAGLRIALVEKEKVGGTCLHRGCIPAKELLETAAVYRTVRGAKEYGIGVDGWTVDFSATQARKRKVIDQQHKGLQGLLQGCKVTTFAGAGSAGSRDAWCGSKVQDGAVTELKAPAIILAAGSVPRTIPGFELGRALRAHERRGPGPRTAARVGRGDRRGGHWVRSSPPMLADMGTG